MPTKSWPAPTSRCTGARRLNYPPLVFEGRGTTRRGGGGVFLSVRKAREFRKSMTPPERRLWNALKTRPQGFKFRKQHEHGPYYLDYFCYEVAVAIEVD